MMDLIRVKTKTTLEVEHRIRELNLQEVQLTYSEEGRPLTGIFNSTVKKKIQEFGTRTWIDSMK